MSNDSNKRRSNLVKIAVAGVMAALIFVATQIRIPIPTGYLNLGDVMINICSFILGPLAAIPAALGSAIADLVAGYPMYIGPTFVIKGLMGLLAGLFFSKSIKQHTRSGEHTIKDYMRSGKYIALSVAVFIGCELIMVLGYFAFEALPQMYGVAGALGSVPYNLIQAAAGIILSVPVIRIPGVYRLRL
ncbi:MAG: ECF transporter S component [Clostridiales bacterium]|nr:ECF transporter S component [Clostridiales bacterium]